MGRMEALSGLFDAAVCLGEVLSRTEDKDTELSSLSTTVRSISASIGTWVLSLPEGERRDLYDSNPVWSKLIEQMKRCEVVLEKRCAIQDGSASTEETRGVWGRLRSMRRSSTTALQEGFEAISGKYGSLARILRLPEDELEVIREASRQLEKLVPLLNLEMQVQSVCRGRKRSHSDAALSPSRKFIDNTPHSRLSSASTQCSSTCSTVGRTHRETAVTEEDVLVTLALVSEFRPAQVAGLPELVSSELRTGGSVSTTSIGSNGDNRNRRIFGRQEVRDKLPRNLMFPGMNGVSAPMNRFVSRDLFAIEVLPPDEVDQMLPSQDELDLSDAEVERRCGRAHALAGRVVESAGRRFGPDRHRFTCQTIWTEQVVLACESGRGSRQRARLHRRVVGVPARHWQARPTEGSRGFQGSLYLGDRSEANVEACGVVRVCARIAI